MSMIRSLLLLGMLLPGASGIAAQEVCKRNIEPRGGFSLCVPDGWTVSEKEGGTMIRQVLAMRAPDRFGDVD